MTKISIVTTDVVEEIVNDTGNIESARSRKFLELNEVATQSIESFLGKGRVVTRDIEKISRGHAFGGHDILHTVIDTTYVAGLAKLGQELFKCLKSWAALNKDREVKVLYEAKSGKRKEIKITGYPAENVEQLLKVITADSE
jgi:hypothetical protein